LALDPADVDSKVNLELLLRTQEQRQKNAAGQPRENQPAQQGAEQKPQQPQGEPARKQEQAQQKPSPGQQPKPQPGDDPQQRSAQQQGQEREQKPDAPSPKAGAEKPVDRTEAQRLLDALRASEKNLQTWRFAKKKTEARKRSDPEKDW
jgi:hypothetical protein